MPQRASLGPRQEGPWRTPSHRKWRSCGTNVSTKPEMLTEPVWKCLACTGVGETLHELKPFRAPPSSGVKCDHNEGASVDFCAVRFWFVCVVPPVFIILVTAQYAPPEDGHSPGARRVVVAPCSKNISIESICEESLGVSSWSWIAECGLVIVG